MQERLRRTGLGALDPAQGLAALGGLLSSAGAPAPAPDVLAVTPIDWPAFLRRFTGRVPPLFQEFTAVGHDDRPAVARRSAGPLRVGVGHAVTMTAEEIAAIVRDAVRDIAGRAVASDEPLMAAGEPFGVFDISREPSVAVVQVEWNAV